MVHVRLVHGERGARAAGGARPPVTFIEGLPRLPVFLADLTGYHPTVQSLVAQASLIAAVRAAGSS